MCSSILGDVINSKLDKLYFTDSVCVHGCRKVSMQKARAVEGQVGDLPSNGAS